MVQLILLECLLYQNATCISGPGHIYKKHAFANTESPSPCFKAYSYLIAINLRHIFKYTKKAFAFACF